jgi:hypothetical protein
MTTSEKPFFTRRHIVGSAGVGLAASVAPALAQGNKSMKGQGLQDPTDIYPNPTASYFFVVCMLRRCCRNKDIVAGFG